MAYWIFMIGYLAFSLSNAYKLPYGNETERGNGIGELIIIITKFNTNVATGIVV